MTREEIIQAISDDKMMPFIQPDQLAGIVDFVIKNYVPSLPSDLDEAAKENGKKEALKDLPRWRKWGNGACGNSVGHPIALVAGYDGIRFVSVLGTTGEKYIMLDDLKKLPGFKEDESHE